MESVGNGWRDELRKYFRSVENLTEKALQLIKCDRIRNNLPFDESFKKYFLERTSFRIANVYVDLMYEDRLEEEANQQSYGNAGASIQHRLASTIISAESVEQMHIILVPPSINENLMRNTTASATCVRNRNQMVTSIPPNQLQSDPSEVGNNRSFDHQSSAQRTDSIAVVDELREKIEISGEPVFESNSNKISPLMTASDQKEVDDTLGSDQNIEGQKLSNVQQKKAYEAPAAGNSKQMDRLNVSSHGCKHSQSKYPTAQTSQPKISILKNQKSQNSASNNSVHRVMNDHEQRQNVRDEPIGRNDCSSAQHSNTIDLMSGHSESVIQNANGAARDVKSIAGLSMPMIQQQYAKFSGEEDTMKRRHTCDFCEYSTDTKSNLTRHIRTHTGIRPYECRVCDVNFSRKDVLNAHMKTHRDLFQFQCSNCRQGFAIKTAWKTHQNRCTAKRYECHLCSKKFYQNKDQLFRHMRHKHTGEKPFRCSDGPQRFRQKSNLTRHTNRYHLKDN